MSRQISSKVRGPEHIRNTLETQQDLKHQMSGDLNECRVQLRELYYECRVSFRD
jgi:hypothetical protein